MVCVMMFSLTACGKGGAEPVKLSSKNISDYIEFKLEFESNGVIKRDPIFPLEVTQEGELVLNTIPVRRGSFEDTTIEIEIRLWNDSWQMSKNEKEYSEMFPSTIKATFRLPVDGYCEETWELCAVDYITIPNFEIGDVSMTIISVNGTVIPS